MIPVPRALRRVGVARLAVALACAGTVSAARADDASPPASDQVRAASRTFREGGRLYAAGDFTRAATEFEAAYALAPHEDALWNAARAWQRAGELARAANLYTRYLAEAPADARDRDNATSAIVQLARRLGRLDVHAPPSTVVTVDGHDLRGGVEYVYPGAHVVRTKSGDEARQQTVTVDAGAVLSVAFTDGPGADERPPPVRDPPRATSAAGSSTSRGDASGTERRRHGVSPWVVVVEGGLTLGATVAAAVSGVDTRRARHAFDRAPTEQALEEGRDKQLRTNVLLGAAGALAAVTAVTAIWLVDWGARDETGRGARLRVAPALQGSAAGVSAEGTF